MVSRAARRATCACALGLVVLLEGQAVAYINPKFTPVHLVRQSATIVAGTVEPAAGSGVWRLVPTSVVKGKSKAGAALRLGGEASKNSAAPLFSRTGKAPAILFAADAAKAKQAFLHVGDHWVALAAAGPGRWTVTGVDPQMSGVYAGGTDALVRMARYIQACPDARVPTVVGTRWIGQSRLATVGGVAAMHAVELAPRGPAHLFVASPQGDRLFRPKPDDEAFAEATAAAKLDTRSKHATWLDADGDGLADLASCDGASVEIRPLRGDGTFGPRNEKAQFAVHGACLGLAPVAASGRPALVVSTAARPFVLLMTGERRELPDGPAIARAGPAATACVVADLDNDGFADVLQPRAPGAVLWRGRADGFEKPVASPVKAAGRAPFAVGDFDGDGFLDLFVSDARSNELWENDGKAGFRTVTRRSGSLSYKTPPGASWCGAPDLNHDGRPDLALAYADTGFVYHFNRGYRCLGEEGGLRLHEAALAAGGPPPGGVVACAVADFNADCGVDLAVAFAGGQVWCYYNDLCDVPVVTARLPKGVTGPVTVSAWQGEDPRFCTGAASVAGHSPPALLCLRHLGRCTLRWRFPGKPEQTKTITVPEEVVQVELTPGG